MKHFFMLMLLSLCLVGCGTDNVIQQATNTVTQPFTSVPHRNWGSYNLYYFTNDQWTKVVSLGQAVSQIPDLGASPVMVVHGLGSSISNGKFTPLARTLVANGATGVIGFEYDTLDSVATNGGYLLQAYQLVTTQFPGRGWRHVGHSMGTLVSRVAFEGGTQLNTAASINKAVLVAGPHTGTPIADVIQRDADVFRQALQYLVFNNIMDFRNSDGQRCDVTGKEPGFTDLRDNGQFTTSLNVGAASRHPQWEYRSMAGDRRGPDFEAVDAILATYCDDGIVNTISANNPVIGQVETATVGQDHSSIIDSQPGLGVVVQFLR